MYTVKVNKCDWWKCLLASIIKIFLPLTILLTLIWMIWNGKSFKDTFNTIDAWINKNWWGTDGSSNANTGGNTKVD